MKTIVLGVGNPILGDDGIGLHVIEQLKTRIHDPQVTIDEAFTGGINLLGMITGYDKAILIDAIKIEQSRTGEVKRIQLADLPTIHSSNPHDVSLGEALSVAKTLGEKHLPREIVVFGIVVNNLSYTFGEHLSPNVARAIPKAVEMIISELNRNKKTCEVRL